jgi:hypothetical protein
MTSLVDPIVRPTGPHARGGSATNAAGLADSLHGFAWWLVDPHGYLETFPGVRWSPGWNDATCHFYPRFFRARWRGLHPIGVPGPLCLCGFRGTHLPQPGGPGVRLSPRIHSGSGGMVFGVIEGAGSQVRNRREWRAAAARPVALYVASEHLVAGEATFGRVAARYGVPVLRDFDSLTRIWGPAGRRPIARPA